ncbi:MAG: LysR substrate-binding domain-containing protein [Pseudomonadota bacterium]
MINLTLKQLRYLDAVARHRHFGRAAEDCSVTQPALSMQIKELEDELRVPLVERGRQVRLTAMGEKVVFRAREILRAVDDIGDIARSAGRRLSGQLRLGVIPTIAPYLLPRLVAALGKSEPEIDIRVRETVTPRLIEELQNGRLDAAIVALPVSEAALAETALFSEPMLVVSPNGEAEPYTPETLVTKRLLLLEEGHCFRDQALEICALGGAAPRDGLDASSLSTLVQMVGAGLGVTLIPEMAVEVETRSAPVTVSRLAGQQPERTVGMVWRKASPLAPQLSDLAKTVQRIAGHAGETVA